MSSYIYLLEQKKEKRFKIGKCNDSSRITQLEKVWGFFDNDSIVFKVNDRTIKKEKAIHTLFDEHRLTLEQKDGYTEFFSTECYEQVYDFMASIFGIDNQVSLYQLCERRQTVHQKLFTYDGIVNERFTKNNSEHNINLARKLKSLGLPINSIESYNNLTEKQKLMILVDVVDVENMSTNEQLFHEQYVTSLKKRKESQRVGIERAKALGKFKGKQKIFSAEKTQELIKMLDQGVSKAEASRIMKISRTTLYTYLKDEEEKNG